MLTCIPSRLNAGGAEKRSDLASMAMPRDVCTDPELGYLSKREYEENRGISRRQETVVPGYVTKDDWGTDGKTPFNPYMDNFRSKSSMKEWQARLIHESRR